MENKVSLLFILSVWSGRQGPVGANAARILEKADPGRLCSEVEQPFTLWDSWCLRGSCAISAFLSSSVSSSLDFFNGGTGCTWTAQKQAGWMPISGSPVPTLGCSSSMFSTLCVNMQFQNIKGVIGALKGALNGVTNGSWEHLQHCIVFLQIPRTVPVEFLCGHTSCISCQVHCHLLEERVQAAEVWQGMCLHPMHPCIALSAPTCFESVGWPWTTLRQVVPSHETSPCGDLRLSWLRLSIFCQCCLDYLDCALQNGPKVSTKQDQSRKPGPFLDYSYILQPHGDFITDESDEVNGQPLPQSQFMQPGLACFVVSV